MFVLVSDYHFVSQCNSPRSPLVCISMGAFHLCYCELCLKLEKAAFTTV